MCVFHSSTLVVLRCIRVFRPRLAERSVASRECLAASLGSLGQSMPANSSRSTRHQEQNVHDRGDKTSRRPGLGLATVSHISGGHDHESHVFDYIQTGRVHTRLARATGRSALSQSNGHDHVDMAGFECSQSDVLDLVSTRQQDGSHRKQQIIV